MSRIARQTVRYFFDKLRKHNIFPERNGVESKGYRYR